MQTRYLLIIAALLIAGCVQVPGQTGNATPSATMEATASATATVRATATATPISTPTPTVAAKMTYLRVVDLQCNPDNIAVGIQNDGPFNTGKPTVRISELDAAGNTVKACMEMTLKTDMLKNSRTDFMFFNKDYAVDGGCEYSSGMRLQFGEVSMDSAAGVEFRPLTLTCP